MAAPADLAENLVQDDLDGLGAVSEDIGQDFSPQDTATQSVAPVSDDVQDGLDEIPKSMRKVELDLDDAPFLADEEEPALEIPPAAQPEAAPHTAEALPAAAASSKFLSRKYLIAAAAGLLLMIACGATIKIVFFSAPKSAPAPVAEHAPKAEDHAAPPVPAAPQPVEQILELEPFWVEKTDSEGKVRFVHLQFALATEVPRMEAEMALKTVMIRDAVYYYLTSKDFTYLADNRNTEALKGDLAAILNQFLSSDKLSTVYLQTYLVK